MHIKLGKLLLRPFEKNDEPSVRSLLSGILQEYGFTIDIQKTDMDYADIGKSYSGGEFWVCVDASNNNAVVGTVAYRPARWARPKGPTNTGSISNVPASSPASPGLVSEAEAELRRLYVAADYRRTGLGAFLLATIEYRAFIAGFTSMMLESASILKQATKLYTQFDYQHTTLPGDTSITKRCDVVMNKKLSSDTFHDFVAVFDAADSGNQFALVPLKIAERCGVPFKRV